MQAVDMPATDPAADRPAIRKLRALGVDVLKLANEPLPDELWEVIANVICGVRGNRARWYTAAAMYGRFITAIKSGASAGELAEQFDGGCALAPLMQQAEMRELVLGSNLPGTFNRWLADVVRRTRLTRREKLAVSDDLIEQYRARLTASETVDGILAQWGEPRTVARGLRRDKLRQRPWRWRAFHTSLRIAGALTLLLVAAIGWMQYRYYSVHPADADDEIERLDARAATVPDADRAWPLYAAGIEKFKMLPQQNQDEGKQSALISAACEVGTQHPSWPGASDHLTGNRAAVDMFLEAAKKPRLGYVRRDPNNDRWMRKLYEGTVDDVFRKRPRQEIRLPEVSVFQNARLLLVGSAYQAAAAGDRDRALDCLAALDSLAHHIWNDEEFFMSRFVALGIDDSMATTMSAVLAADGDSWTDDDLLRCLKLLRSRDLRSRGELLSAFLQAYRQYLIDMYSSDGRFTREGFEALCAQPFKAPQLAWLTDLVQTTKMTPSGATSKLGMALVGPCIVPFVARREELLKEFDAQCERYLAELQSQPAGIPESGGDGEQLNAWLESKTTQLRYFPLLAEDRFAFQKAAIEGRWTKFAECEGTAVGVASQIYHRRHGAWPDSVEGLVPEFLEAAPVDPNDGRPLRLVIIKDRPYVYSVGLDGKDATANTPAGKLKEIDRRDWQLYPPLEPTAGAEPAN
jgi:hypothetical protein